MMLGEIRTSRRRSKRKNRGITLQKISGSHADASSDNFPISGSIISRACRNIVSRRHGERTRLRLSADRKMRRDSTRRDEPRARALRRALRRRVSLSPLCISDEPPPGHPREWLEGAVLRAYVHVRAGSITRREGETRRGRAMAGLSFVDRIALRWVAANTATLVSDIIAPRSFHPRAPAGFCSLIGHLPFAAHEEDIHLFRVR